MGLECGWHHAQKRWAENLEDFEKYSVEVRIWWEKLRSDHRVEKLKSDHAIEGLQTIEFLPLSWVFYRGGGG